MEEASQVCSDRDIWRSVFSAYSHEESGGNIILVSTKLNLETHKLVINNMRILICNMCTPFFGPAIYFATTGFLKEIDP